MTGDIRSSKEFFQTRFEELRLDEDRIDGAIFEECAFARSSLESCSIVDCVFVSCTFADCNLSLTKLTNCRFNDVVFRRSKLTGVSWTKSASSAVGNTVHFEECALNYAVFTGYRLRGWAFRRCSLVEADFSEADLDGTVFLGSDLDRAQFHHTNLSGAHLEGAYNYSINVETNRITGAYFSLPEAASLLTHLGIHLVESPELAAPE